MARQPQTPGAAKAATPDPVEETKNDQGTPDIDQSQLVADLQKELAEAKAALLASQQVNSNADLGTSDPVADEGKPYLSEYGWTRG